MNMRRWIFSGLALAAAGWFFVISSNNDASPMQTLKQALRMDEAPLPDFTQYTDVKAKKRAFFDYLQPIVAINNQRIWISAHASTHWRISPMMHFPVRTSALSTAWSNGTKWMLKPVQSVNAPSF